MNDLCQQILGHYSDFKHASIQSCAGQSGLSGARLWKLQPPDSECAYVLRCWPAGHPSYAHLTWIHRVIRHAFANGCHFLSVPLLNARGQTITLGSDVPSASISAAEFHSSGSLEGELWEVSPWMPGQADFNLRPNVVRLRQMLQALARFHQASAQVTLDFHTSQNLQRRRAVLQQLSDPASAMLGELDKASLRAVDPSERDSFKRVGPIQGEGFQRVGSLELAESKLGPLLDELRQIFLQSADRLISQLLIGPLENAGSKSRLDLSQAAIAVPGAPASGDSLIGGSWTSQFDSLVLPVQPILRDIWHDHVLFSGDEVTGMIDYGAMQVDTVAFDIARLLGTTAADDPGLWEQGLAAYSELRPLSGLERRLIPWIDQTGVLLGSYHWLRWLLIEGRQFDNLSLVRERIAFLTARLKRLIEKLSIP